MLSTVLALAAYVGVVSSQDAYTVTAPTRGAGSYGLAFVAPSTYGYGDRGAYAGTRGPYTGAPEAAAFGFTGFPSSGVGPAKYAFPVFDHNQGYGGYGALGYYGVNLGFAYPGYGYGNGLFGQRSYGNPFV